jgi:hypothetical protein
VWNLFHSILRTDKNRLDEWPIQAVFWLEWGRSTAESIRLSIVCRNPLAIQIPIHHANSAIEFILQHLAPKPLRRHGPSVSLFEDFFRRILLMSDPDSTI